MDTDKDTVLVLAGDIGSLHKPKCLIKAIDHVAPRFKHVLYVAGNHCLDTETECLTRRGWLNYNDIKDTDTILSLNIDTGKSEWTGIDSIIIREEKESLYSMDTGVFNMKVTEKHRVLHKSRTEKNGQRVWSDFKYTEAKDLTKNDHSIPVSALTYSEDYDISDKMLKLLAWILTDGSLPSKCNGIYIYQSKESNIQQLLESLYLDYSVRTRNRNTTHICGRKLVNKPLPSKEYYIKANNGRVIREHLPEGRTIPSWMLDSLSSRQIELFVKGVVDGDGSWTKNKDGSNSKCAMVHGTKEFLDKLQILCVQGGISTKLSVARVKDYRLSITLNRTERQLGNPGRFVKEEYTGDVWCLSVPHTNFMVRRKGCAFFTGNCYYGGSLKDGVIEINNLIKHHSNIIFDNFEKIPFECLGSSNKINDVWLATLWTDYRNGNPIEMQKCEGVMNDHNYIRGFKGEYATANDFLEVHNCMREQLFEGLKFGDIVISHHLPSYQSVAHKYKGDLSNSAYASELSHIIEDKAPRLWIHGHTHESCDYKIGHTRVICNPCGYWFERNKEYNNKLIIEV